MMRFKSCDIVKDRPGVIVPFIIPARMKNQVRLGPTTPLDFSIAGKNSVGYPQWVIEVQRPGIAEPLIEAKALTQAAQADVKADMMAKAAEVPAPKGLSGYGRRQRR